MLRLLLCLLLPLFIASNLFSQVIHYPHKYITAKTISLKYPINAIDIRALGMGNTQIANGKTFNAMMYNPALLGHERNSIEIFGMQTGMPATTFSAANYLSENIDEFVEAISLNQIWDGMDKLTQPGSTIEQKLDAIQEIQEGMVFINDLVIEVTGPGDAPKVHGISISPGISGQFGNFGFSLYGFGQAGFLVQLSPTFESLQEIEIPTNLSNKIETARAVIQLTAALAPAVIGPEKFSDEAYPTAYYSSYFDIVGTAGYGFPINEKLTLGANLKIINRRFVLDKIAVKDYEEIIRNIWSKFKSDVTGLTIDLGALYQFETGTSVGATFQNVVPVKEIKKSVTTEFRFNKILHYEISPEGKIDSLRYATWGATISRPFSLKAPFIMSFGVHHPLSENWDIAFDWVDILENDSRYEESAERIHLGTEYRYNALKDALRIIPRLGMSDKRATVGLGFNIYKNIFVDGAYAYDRFVNKYAYYAQFKIGW